MLFLNYANPKQNRGKAIFVGSFKAPNLKSKKKLSKNKPEFWFNFFSRKF